MFNYIEEFIEEHSTYGYTMDDYADNFIKETVSLTDEEFAELLLYVYIPETYDDNSSEEKIYTKLIEVLVKIWADRMGYNATLIKKNSGVEDVRIFIDSSFIVCDAKTYRLSRSQKAPNVKDFVQLDSIYEWIGNAQTENMDLKSSGGLITYTESHEWSRSSDVYRQCSNPDTPILMLPYNILSVLLKFKDHMNSPEDILKLWNFDQVFGDNVRTNNKKKYWNSLNKAIHSLINPSNDSDLNKEFKIYFESLEKKHHLNIKKQLMELNKNSKKNIDYVIEEVKSIEDKNLLEQELISYRVDKMNNPIEKKIENIKKFRL